MSNGSDDHGVRHFLADDDLTQVEQRELLDLADALKADPLAEQPFAPSDTVALLFDKSSTRTRISFETGVVELGGHPMVIDTKSSQLGRGESIADTARILGRNVRLVVWRTGGQERIEEMAAYAGVPVINGLTDEFHSCQILADLMTVRERLGALPGLTLAYFGDGANNMAHSYLLGGAVAGLHVRIAAPAGYQPDPAVVQRATRIAERAGGSITLTESAPEAAEAADVLTTDTWISMGQEAENAARETMFTPYQINDQLVSVASPEAIVMHCLPAYRGKEITAEVLEGPRSVVWDEAENRRHAQKALMVLLHRWAAGMHP